MMKIILIRFNTSYKNKKIRIKKKLRNFTNLKQIQTLRKMVNKSNKKLKKFNGINKKKMTFYKPEKKKKNNYFLWLNIPIFLEFLCIIS